MSLMQAVTLAPSHANRLRQSWDLSSPLLFPLYLKHQSQANSELYIISPTHTIPSIMPPPSTPTSTAMNTPAPGERSRQSPCSSPISLLDPRPLCAMLWRPTGPSQSSQHSGQVWSSTCKGRTSMRSTCAMILASHQLGAFMGCWPMQELTSSAATALVHYQNGWTITSSSASHASLFQTTMPSVPFGAVRYKLMAVADRMPSRIWYGGKELLNGLLEEFDEECSAPFKDQADSSPCPTIDCIFSYADTDINQISEHLGICWESSKSVPFGSVVPYLGFHWNLDTHVVHLLGEKKARYVAAIEEWEAKHTHNLLETQKLYGKLLHASLVIPSGRAYLTSMEAMLGTFNHRPFLPHTPP